MDERTREFLQYAMHVSELGNECPCPKLLMIALDNGITLEDLRNEIRLLISMPDDEVKKYNVKPYQK